MRITRLAVGCASFLLTLGTVLSPLPASELPADPETGQESAEVPNLPQADPEQVAAADLPVHDEPAGTLAGEAGVDGGAAIYSVPLVVPPGRAGMQPALGLAYSSRSGNGIAGVGWALTGTSSLHRCPRTPEQDGETRGVSYDNNDRLCLDGQRLIAVTAPGGSNPGTYGAAGTHYRTEIDSFVRVIQVGGNLAGNSACFRVEEKSGRILHYGAVASGTDPAAPTTCTSATSARVQPSGAAATLSWLLEKVEDRVGNNLRYEYTVYGTGENLLKQVLYTGLGAQAGDRKVVIDYSARIDIGSSYLDGGLTEQTQKLSKITTKIGDTTVRTLTPTYVSGTFSDRLLLKELTECANRNTTGTTLNMVCHPKTVFGWNDGTPNIVLSSLTVANLPGAGTDLPTGGGVAGSRQLRVVGDLDGDGARETVLAVPQGSGSTADIYLVQLAADRSVRAAVNFTSKLSVLPERYADMDGDGRAEVLSLPAAGAPQVVSLGIWTLGRGAAVTANAFHFVPTTVASPASVAAGSLFTADVGGDGKLDLITTGPAASCGSDVLGTKTGVFIHTNAMTGRLSTSSTTASFTSSATPLFCLGRSATTSTNVTLDERIERIADFNGDGLPDFFLSNSGTGNNKTFSRILLGQGTSTQSISCSNLGSPALSTDECDRSKGYVAQWQDINGDGLDDFVFAKPGGNWQLRLNKGGSLGALITTASNAGLKTHTTAAGTRFRYADRLPAMDVDNDGKTDLLAVTGDYQGFAMKMCVAARVGQLPSGECPDSTRDVEAGQCLAYACPQDPGSGALNMPANGLNIPGYPAVWQLPGGTTVPVFAMYDSSTLDFSGNDQSAYYVDQLKFVQTGPSSFTVQNLPTAMVTKLQQSAADDVFGDGLSDLVTELGCQFKQVTHNGANQPGCLVIGESATYGNSYGPTHLPNGRPVSDFNAILSGGSYISVLEATVNENRGVYLPSNGEGRNTDVPLDLGPEAPVATATAAASPVLPDVLRNATDGLGDIAAWNLVAMAFPAVQNQIPLYSVPSDHGYADSRHYYFASTMPVVTGFAQHSGLRDSGGKPDMSGWRSAVYGYREAMYNHFGRGFQGFRAIVSDSAFNQANKRVRTTTTFHQKFPLTGRVESVVVTVPNTTQRISEELNTWKCGRSNRGDCLLGDSLATPTGLAAPFLDQQRVNAYEPDSGVLSHHTLTVNAGSVAGGVSGWDSYGNLVEQLVIQADDGADSFLTEHSTRTVNVYDPAPAYITQWWTDRLSSSSVTRQISYAGTHSLPSGASAPAQTVIADTSWNADRTLLSRSIQSGVAGQQSTTSYSYTSGGLPSQVVVTLPDLPAADPSRVRTVNYTYSKDGENPASDGYFVLDTTNALSQITTTKTAPRDGQVVEAKDPNNLRTTTAYDAFGRVTRVDYYNAIGGVAASPMQMALTRCTAGVCAGGAAAEDFTPNVAVLRQTTVRAGYPTTIDWTDVLGRSVKQASGSFAGDFSLSLTTYDLQGKVATQSTPFFKTQPVNYTSLQYDRVGRLTQKTAPGSSLDVTNGNLVSSYAYTGRKTKVTVRGSNVALSGGNCPAQPALPATAKLCLQVERSNDARGALMQTKDAAGRIVDYWTDAQGQVAAINDDTGLITATYNALGHRLTSKDPDQGYWQFESNALGELLKQTDSRGAVTRVTVRDVLGRVKQQTTVPPTVVPAGMDANAFHDEWEYDPANALGAVYRVTRRRGANVAAPETNTRVWRETYTYDSAARVIDTATSINEGSTTAFSRTQSYDAVTGRPLTRVYASGLAVKTAYTAYGQPSKLSNAVTGFVYWAATAHNAWGQVSGENLANGISGTYTTDQATGQPTQRRWTKSGVTLDQIDYTYDSFANLKSQLRAGNAETYTYDVRQRLVRSSRTSGGIVDYRYTPNGNLERKTDYSADVANAYTYGPGVDLGNGNCGPHAATSVTLPGSGLDTYTCDRNGNVVGGNTLSLRFAADNRPVYSARPSTSVTTQWAYSSDGFRYYALSSRGVTYFDREGYESTGAVVRHELGPVIVERQNGVDTVTAVLTDRLGSTIATVDTATETRAYDAFGQVRNRDLTNKPNGTLNLPRSIHGFTQHEHADDVRLIHMKGRLYDYKLGRFLSVDPLVQFPANSQSLNPYSYIMNNPLAGTDPTGFAQKDARSICSRSPGSCGSILSTDTLSALSSVQEAPRKGLTQLAVERTAAVSVGVLLSPSNGADNGQTPAGAGGAQNQQASPYAQGQQSNNTSAAAPGGANGGITLPVTVVTPSRTPKPYDVNLPELQKDYPAITTEMVDAAYAWLVVQNPKSAYADPSTKAETEYSAEINAGPSGLSTGPTRQGSAGKTSWSISRTATVALAHTHGYGGDYFYAYFSEDDIAAADSVPGRPLAVFLANGRGDFSVFFPGMPTGGKVQGSTRRLPDTISPGFQLCSACVPIAPPKEKK